MIDSIFDYKNYRYVPIELRMEWKTLYNLYKGGYFIKQHKLFKIFPQNRIDYYNEELLRLNRVEKMVKKRVNKRYRPFRKNLMKHKKNLTEDFEKMVHSMTKK